MEPGVFGGEASGQGKAARTRAKLMDAAISVFARTGLEAGSINEIAAQAEVANGTFYNHFRDKDELVSCVALAMAGDVARQLNEEMEGVASAAERTSYATRRFVEIAVSRPEWGWVLARALPALGELRRPVMAYARADMDMGVASGEFKIEVDDFTADIFVSMVTTAVLARLRGEAGEEAGCKAAELQLRLLGVAPARAKTLAWRALAG